IKRSWWWGRGQWAPAFAGVTWGVGGERAPWTSACAGVTWETGGYRPVTGLERVDLLLQAPDETGQAAIAGPFQPRRREDRPQLLHRVLKVAVYQHVVVFGEVLHLDPGVLEPALDDRLAVLRP